MKTFQGFDDYITKHRRITGSKPKEVSALLILIITVVAFILI